MVWGVSDNTRRRFALTGAYALGYRSRDDAERHATAGFESRTDPFTDALVGGEFCGPAYDAPTDAR